MKTTRLVNSRCLATIALLLFAALAAPAATITWDTPATIAGDSDVATNGNPVFAYDISSLASVVNGVSFTAPGPGISQSGFYTAGANQLIFCAATSFTPAYTNVLCAAIWVTPNGPGTITLNNLTVGHSYLVQIWVADYRQYPNARTETVAAGNTSGDLAYLTGDGTNPGSGTGSYVIGTFTADATTESMTLSGNESTQLNALQLRDTTVFGQGYWNGLNGGTWDASTTANWCLNNSTDPLTNGIFSDAMALSGGAAYFADSFYSNGVALPVTQSNVTVAAGGVSATTINFPGSSVAYTLNSADANGITGATALNKSGSATVTLAGGNTFSGDTTIFGGAVKLGNANALSNSTVSVIVSSGLTFASGIGTFTLGGLAGVNNFALTDTGAGAVTLQAGNNGVDSTYSGDMSGAGGLTKVGPGTLTLSAQNDYTGPTVVNGGGLVLQSGGGNYTYNGGNVAINNGSSFTFSGSRYNISGKTFTFDSNGGGTFTFTYGGHTPQGGLVFLTSNTFVTGGGAQDIIADDGAEGYNINNSAVTFNVVRGSDSVSDLKVTAILWNSSASPAVTKTGNGILELAAINDYTGGTTVSNGTLLISVSGTINAGVKVSGGTLQVEGQTGFANSGTVTVQSGGILCGMGLINNPVTIQSGGALTTEPGSIGTLTINNTLSLAGDVNLRINGDTSTSDSLSGMSGVTYGGTLTVTNLGTNPLTAGQSFTLFTKYSGTYNGSFSTIVLPPLPLGLSWDTSSLTVDGSISVINAVGTPTFNPPQGGYVGTEPLAVTISSPTPGATIYYSMDNWATTNTYSGPVAVPVNTNLTLVAYAHLDGYNDSAVASATYATEPTAVWTSLYGGSWSTDSNWTNNIIPNNSGALADFSTLTLPYQAYVSLDGAWTAGHLLFGDVGNAYPWEIDAGSSGSLNLAAPSNAPVIQVVNQGATINAPISGGSGLTKNGTGALTLGVANSYSGGTSISQGILEIMDYNGAGSDPVTLGDANTGTNDVQLILDGISLPYTGGIGNAIQVSTNGTGAATISFTETGTWFNYSALTLNRPTTINATSSDQATLEGLISGNVGSLTVNGGTNGGVNGGVNFALPGYTPGSFNTFTGTVVLASGNMASWPGGLGAANPVVIQSGTYTLKSRFLSDPTPNITTIGSLSGGGSVSGNGSQNLSIGNDNGSGTYSGVISGSATAVIKTGTGTETLSGTNTYTGATTVSNGILVVNGSLGNSAVTVVAGATLGGNGTIGGAVTDNGTLVVGTTNLDSLTINSNLVLNGNATFNISKTGGTPAQNQVLGTTAVTYGGTLTVANITSDTNTLASGDTFPLFPDGTYGGSFATTNLPVLASGLEWDLSQLTVNGSIRVVTSSSLPPTLSGGESLGGGQFALTFSGPDGQSYTVLTSTNVVLPLASWDVLTTGTFGASPVNYTNTTATNNMQFYVIKSP